MVGGVLACSVFGHRYRFTAEGSTMRWQCGRGCGVGGSKDYPSPDVAGRYAAEFDRDGLHDLGKRAPLIGLLPLRIWRRLHSRTDSE